MPSSATITAFYTFAPLTSIRSSEVNNNFGLFRGHLLPIDASATSISNRAYDLGSTDYAWRSVFAKETYLYQNTAGSIPATPPAGQMALYFKDDGLLYRKNPAGTETAVGSGGGGGGSSVNWVEDALAPTVVFEYSGQAYAFQDALTQYLYAQVRVPSSYSAGGQINLRGIFYGNATSTNVLMQTQATLIRTGTDAMSSTTNQRTSTNSAVTMATTANRPNAFVCDLTSATGQINGVSVAAGDLILVRLTRDTATDTATVDAMVPVFSSEVTFT